MGAGVGSWMVNLTNIEDLKIGITVAVTLLSLSILMAVDGGGEI